MTTKGKIIALEGGDQAGKATQAHLLQMALKSLGHDAKIISFPNYDTKIGRIIADWLAGSYPEFDIATIQLLYAADKQQMVKEINFWLSEGKIIIMDRYYYSALVYANAYGGPSLMTWVVDLHKHLPRPDISLYLDVPAKVRMQRKLIGKDLMEQNSQLQFMVDETYKALSYPLGFNYFPLMIRICVSPEDTPEITHSKILSTLREREIIDGH